MLDSYRIKDIENRIVAIFSTREVVDGALPLHHSSALEVQLNGLEILASNCEVHGTISGP
jgi:hypothetical protein